MATKDRYGAATTVWTQFAAVYASIEQMKAYDKAAAAATYPGADHTITMRYLAGVTAIMRVVHGSEIYSVLGPPNNIDGRNRMLILTCQSGVKTV